MKIILAFISLALSSQIALAQSATFMGPVLSCELTNTSHMPQTYKLDIFTAQIFGPIEESQVLQVYYNFPKASSAPNLNFITEMTQTKKAVFTGQVTNISYLIDASLNLNNQTLTLKDKGQTYKFTGSCTSPMSH